MPTVRTQTRVLYSVVMVVGRPIGIGGGAYREEGCCRFRYRFRCREQI